jgi:DNA-binding transcriptional MerR regulator
VKEDKLFYSIREVSEQFNLTYATLRFWEKEIRELKPEKNKRGVRSYSKKSVQLIETILYLTRQKGYTLEGVKKYLKGEKFEAIDKKAEVIRTLQEIKGLLLDIKQGIEAGEID